MKIGFQSFKIAFIFKTPKKEQKNKKNKLDDLS